MAGEQLPNYWVKCFSKTRKIDYYFNTKTLKSLWTIEEVLESEKKSTNINNEMIVLSGKSGSINKPLIAKQKTNKDKLQKVDISKTLKEKISKTLKTNKLILKESKINKIKEQIVKAPISKIKTKGINKNLTKIQTDDVIVCNENSKTPKIIETEDTEAMEVDIIENVRIYNNNKF